MIPKPLDCAHCKATFTVVNDGAAEFYCRHVSDCCDSHIQRLNDAGLVSFPDDTYPARPNLLRGFRYDLERHMCVLCGYVDHPGSACRPAAWRRSETYAQV